MKNFEILSFKTHYSKKTSISYTAEPMVVDLQRDHIWDLIDITLWNNNLLYLWLTQANLLYKLGCPFSLLLVKKAATYLIALYLPCTKLSVHFPCSLLKKNAATYLLLYEPLCTFLSIFLAPWKNWCYKFSIIWNLSKPVCPFSLLLANRCYNISPTLWSFYKLLCTFALFPVKKWFYLQISYYK